MRATASQVPTLLRDVPFSAIYWLGYEQAKSKVSLPGSWLGVGSARTAATSFVCGAGAGMVAAVLIAPLDVIKTVRQHHIENGQASSYRSILGTLRKSPVVAFAGLGPRLVRVPAGMATMMAGLEVTKLWFESRRASRQ